MFICRHCPYVVHVREEILRIAHDYQRKGVTFVAICSNDATSYPDDADFTEIAMGFTRDLPAAP